MQCSKETLGVGVSCIRSVSGYFLIARHQNWVFMSTCRVSSRLKIPKCGLLLVDCGLLLRPLRSGGRISGGWSSFYLAKLATSTRTKKERSRPHSLPTCLHTPAKEPADRFRRRSNIISSSFTAALSLCSWRGSTAKFISDVDKLIPSTNCYLRTRRKLFE